MIGGWLRRVRELFTPGRIDREAVEEMTQHVELLVARKVAEGVDEPEARRQARLKLGSVQSAREQLAGDRQGVAIEQLARELRYAARVLRRSPGTTALSVLTMAAGIGASGILFALVNGILLRPLPYPEPDRLVRVFDTSVAASIDRTGVTTGNLASWRERTTWLDGIAGYYSMGRTVSDGSDSEALITAQVTRDFFDIAGVPAFAGRAFTADEYARADFNSAAAPIGADPVLMISHGLWQRRFGADPSIVGRTVQLERRPFRIVGVMPPGFALPDPGVQVWIPWHVDTADARDQHYVGGLARVKAGVSIAQADAELNAVARRLGEEHPETNRGWGVRLSPLADEAVGRAGAVLWMLLAAVGLVLLAVCANVALLSLIRGLDRRHEGAVRVALGASAGRLLREYLLESALLAAAGGALGVVITWAGLAWLPSLTADLPRLAEVGFDARALAFVLTVTLGSAIVSGLPQAWRRSTTAAPMAGLSAAARRSTAGAGHHLLRNAIVVAQIATAVILMLGSALLVRSFGALQATDPGFDPRGVLVAPVFLDNQQYNSGDKTRTYYRNLFARLEAVPGVIAVGGATTVPTSPLGPDFERPVWPLGADSDPARRVPAAVRMITPGYIEAMGLRLAAGRTFDDRDAPQAPRVLMVSETLARRLWPGQSAVGRQLVVDYSTAGTYPYEVVGVIGDMRFRGPRSEPLAEIYIPHAQRSYLILNVVVKANGDPREMIPAVRAALREVDRDKPAQGLFALEDLLGATYARDRQAMVTLLVFAGAAIFLAVLGVYGVLSQHVRERTREIGIRMAMGADAPRLMSWVAASGLRLIAVGVAAGAAVAAVVRGALEGLLFGVQATDGVALASVVAGLVAIGLVATLIPSWRAARIDPVEILRRE